MTAFSEATGAARRFGLGVVGWFHPVAQDGVPDDPGTLLLLGPDGPDLWAAFRVAPELGDGAPDPMDRWSRRVITEMATRFGAAALFPFGGPPWLPFQRWAARGEGARVSPVALQVTAGRGLWASYRGALAFPERLDLPPRADTDPCRDCPAPCLAACPVDAFVEGAYDVPACTAHLAARPGPCHRGCLVRRACPAGMDTDLPVDQRAFHMAAFLRANRPA